MEMSNYTFLTTAPVPRVVARMSVSTIATMLVTSIYNLADTFFVGYISTHKLTIHRSWEPEDPTAWGADAAYRRYFGSEHAPSGDFLLLYGDRIVEFEPNRELTAAQRAIVGEALRPGA